MSRRLVELVVGERQRGRSLRGIAYSLTIYGERPPRGGRTWAHSTVRLILVRERQL